uniref:tRNA_SAD domain-containing protein n=1 Tax=Gongylonema pulchrum TaxID=637853 RepID=A0A183DFT0_9BILA
LELFSSLIFRHVSSTKDIGKFVVVGLKSRTAGVRRLYALTSHAARKSTDLADTLEREMCCALDENNENYIDTPKFLKVCARKRSSTIMHATVI